MEHEYQHHVAEGSQVHLRKRKTFHDQIDLKLEDERNTGDARQYFRIFMTRNSILMPRSRTFLQG